MLRLLPPILLLPLRCRRWRRTGACVLGKGDHAISIHIPRTKVLMNRIQVRKFTGTKSMHAIHLMNDTHSMHAMHSMLLLHSTLAYY
jgi:hypothetical protein